MPSVIAERVQPHGSGWESSAESVERAMTWLHGFLCMRTRWNGATTSTKHSSVASPA
ncbi:hypothetical protein AB0I54_45695 [Streptomyces sp. NPDC050625]|uniref:hypothetical protein n=1 Tax=Streptomyces sp. NPDC050625 TaxID=3154629 RepID=UPI00344182F0